MSLKNLEVSKRVLTQALNKARDLSVPLFIGGDLRDTKAIIRGEEINMLNTLFSENNDVRVLLMVGNHDLMNKNSDAHSLEFLRHHSNITIIDGPLVLDTEGGIGRFYCIPYKKTKEEFQEEIKRAKELGFTRILGHQGVQGAKMGDYVVDESSICPKELESFEFIGLGHYHKSQDLGNVRYWGSPFTVNFGESSDRKCFWVVNEDDNNKIQLEPIPTDVRHHRQMVVLEGYKSHEDWPDYNEGDPIKVILKGAKEFALRSHEKQFKKLYPNNPITFV
ncbi:MAG: hypothetical protein K0U41_06895, partial [Gammaproteobacteria bacterium]|nr:hypothetical protein [Gammaproteobacteria bacterium]